MRKGHAISRMRGACFALITLVAACVQLPAELTAPMLYQNPIMNSDFPDPAILRAPDGWFYAYATQTTLGERVINIQVARTRDLVRWEHLGDALPQKPQWASKTQNFWAPDVIFDPQRSRFLMYYSGQRDEKKDFCLAVASAASPAGPFVDSGVPMACGTEHIDPMAFDDPKSGKSFLYWGFGSIRVQELAPDRLRFADGSVPVQVLLPGQEQEYSRIVEGAWVTYRDGQYFLFYSGDYCCGAEPSYAVMAARADNPLGPFRRLAEENGNKRSVILERNELWRAPGHNSVIRDAAGGDWILYHAVDSRQPMLMDKIHGPVARRVLMLDRIEYLDGWPRIPQGQPSTAPQPAPVVQSMLPS